MKKQLIREQVEKDVEQGMTLTAISKKYEMPLVTTYRKLKALGLKPTKRRTYLKGQRFNRLVVIEEDRSKKNGSWICQCDCGKFKSVKADHLISRQTESCGCLAHDLRWKGHEEISGDYWNGVLRGATTRSLSVEIKIDDAWEQYLKQDRRCALSGVELCFDGSKRIKNQTASLDRIDSNKGYTKDNIQWVHKTIQKMKMDLKESVFLEFCERVATCRRTL
jgi:hypothetical protein